MSHTHNITQQVSSVSWRVGKILLLSSQFSYSKWISEHTGSVLKYYFLISVSYIASSIRFVITRKSWIYSFSYIHKSQKLQINGPQPHHQPREYIPKRNSEMGGHRKELRNSARKKICGKKVLEEMVACIIL